MQEAFVSAIGFPRNVAAFVDQIVKNLDCPEGSYSDRYFDLDLVSRPTGESRNWTVPIWAQPGDICVFYVVGRMRAYISEIASDLRRNGVPKHLLSQMSWDGDPLEMIAEYLNVADLRAQEFGGTVVAVGRVETFPYSESSEGHFRDRTFASISDISALSRPIPYERIRSEVPLRRAATISRLTASGWLTIKNNMDASDIKTWIRSTSIGMDSLPDRIRGNWRSIINEGYYRCKTESELRELVVDPFLLEMSDPGSPVLSECQCVGGAGIVDSVVRVNGKWHMIEVKRKITNIGALVNQIAKYLPSHQVRPAGNRIVSGLVPIDRHETRLIFDGCGVFRASASGLHNCELERPICSWIEAARLDAVQLRNIIFGEK